MSAVERVKPNGSSWQVHFPALEDRVDAEEEVLGSILCGAALDRDAGWRLVDRSRTAGLRPEDFYMPSNGALYALISRMRDEQIPVDALAVSVELERLAERALEDLRDLVGAVVERTWILGRLRELAVLAPPFEALEHRVGLVLEAARRREVTT